MKPDDEGTQPRRINRNMRIKEALRPVRDAEARLAVVMREQYKPGTPVKWLRTVSEGVRHGVALESQGFLIPVIRVRENISQKIRMVTAEQILMGGDYD